jgi:hypothetical protein
MDLPEAMPARAGRLAVALDGDDLADAVAVEVRRSERRVVRDERDEQADGPVRTDGERPRRAAMGADARDDDAVGERVAGRRKALDRAEELRVRKAVSSSRQRRPQRW